MTFVSELEPKDLWRHFDRMLTIPRGSRNEQQMADYVIEIAKKRGLPYKQDGIGNLVVSKPGVSGREQAAITILQSHLDMVNDKNEDVDHNFETDAIKPRKEGDYLYATGTTLGSDNGVGVAAQLALVEDHSIQHGPLELLFTVDEETGLTGAANLQTDFLKGRQLINLDTEEQGALYVGCAGGAGLDITLPIAHEAIPKNVDALDIKLAGLCGGHSGVDIHLQRGNAVTLLARALTAVADQVEFYLASFSGGNMRNAIPREAFAKVAVSTALRGSFSDALSEQTAKIQAEFRPVDPDLTLTVVETDSVDTIMSPEAAHRVLNLLNALPHGVISMSYAIPGLVETSSNLATVKTDGDRMRIHVSNRSSVTSSMRAIQERVASVVRLAGGRVTYVEGYPGWQPTLDSPILGVVKAVHKDVLDKEPEVKAIHAGLECGIIGQKYPDMDMISFGPQIEFPHSPGERVKISSVADFYGLLTAVLERLDPN